jgi:hypothetical protein
VTSELLDGAAGVIERNGWIQGEYFSAADFDGGKGPAACAVCPRGAIAVAACHHPMFKAAWPTYCAVEDQPSRDEIADVEAIRSAEQALLRHLALAGRESIEAWADLDDRTLPQILGALRAAAQAEREAGR